MNKITITFDMAGEGSHAHIIEKFEKRQVEIQDGQSARDLFNTLASTMEISAIILKARGK